MAAFWRPGNRQLGDRALGFGALHTLRPITASCGRPQKRLPRLVAYKPGSRVSFFSELQRRNVALVAIAYTVTAWLLLQVSDVVMENIGAPPRVTQTLH